MSSFIKRFLGLAEDLKPVRAERADMDAAIKQIVLPVLREMGFKGSLPHLRRIRNDCVEIIAFQFRSAGGAFVVELGRIPASGLTRTSGVALPAEAVRHSHLRYRYRLGSSLDRDGDYWFRFSDQDPGVVATKVVCWLRDEKVWSRIDALPLNESSGF